MEYQHKRYLARMSKLPSRFRIRRGAVGANVIVAIIVMVVGLSIAAYFIAALQPSSLGTLANASLSTSNAMKNVDPTAKSLFSQYPLIIILVTFSALAAIVFVVLRGGALGGKGN